MGKLNPECHPEIPPFERKNIPLYSGKRRNEFHIVECVEKCRIILAEMHYSPVLSAAIYETGTGRPLQVQAAHSPAPHKGRGGARSIRPAKLPQRASRSVSFAEAPAWRPQDAPTGWDSIRRRRRALGSPFRNRFCGDGRRCPHPRLVRLRLSARSHGGGNRLVAARVKQRFSGNNSALPLIHQVFAVIVASASCHAPS